MGTLGDWGTTVAERALPLPCDDLVPGAHTHLNRAVDVHAPAATVFPWLCQLRVAPYSYDTLDNLGRQSPQTLTPGLEELAVGQRIASIFRITAFETGRSLTMVTRHPLFGHVGCTYLAAPAPGGDPGRSRLLVRFVVRYPGLPFGPVMRLVLPPGDLVMARRQLLNLKGLAEAQAR
ncbi:hypothetical protein DSM112329_01035 [Paraconexibacter sp. AEG42_29]|uniref:SRPBCC family protein n=1 Tax=Paraconexibacter sp. AEG42_29 TaxID=2997339 RepID=A0AAU7ARE4_9ACTN